LERAGAFFGLGGEGEDGHGRSIALPTPLYHGDSQQTRQVFVRIVRDYGIISPLPRGGTSCPGRASSVPERDILPPGGGYAR
jgi:hypothetical protein